MNTSLLFLVLLRLAAPVFNSVFGHIGRLDRRDESDEIQQEQGAGVVVHTNQLALNRTQDARCKGRGKGGLLRFFYTLGRRAPLRSHYATTATANRYKRTAVSAAIPSQSSSNHRRKRINHRRTLLSTRLKTYLTTAVSCNVNKSHAYNTPSIERGANNDDANGNRNES